jgi:hypothetical protein
MNDLKVGVEGVRPLVVSRTVLSELTSARFNCESPLVALAPQLVVKAQIADTVHGDEFHFPVREAPNQAAAELLKVLL